MVNGDIDMVNIAHDEDESLDQWWKIPESWKKPEPSLKVTV